MKKVLAIILSLVIVACAGVMAFADGGFVSSPSGDKAPSIEVVIPDINIDIPDLSCKTSIVVTPYAEREKLSDEKEKELNDAYAEINANKDLSKICDELKAVATKLGKNHINFAVSDLFDISIYHSHPHDSCGEHTVKLKSENLNNNFVALLHRNSDGKWEVVDNAAYNAVDDTVMFSSAHFSPYAIVVDKTAANIPNMGSTIYIPAIVMAVSAISLAVVLFSLKKKQKV